MILIYIFKCYYQNDTTGYFIVQYVITFYKNEINYIQDDLFNFI